MLGGSDTQLYVAPPAAVLLKNPAIRREIATTTTMKTAVIASTTKDKKTEVLSKKPVTKTVTRTTNTQATSTIPVNPPPQTPVIKNVWPTFDFETINKNAREAVVNILCSTRGGELSPISGTGVVVGQDGLILTNAHIAQYLLLKDYGQKDRISCVARTGSPAYPRYNLELVYISPIWVNNNKGLLKEQNPQGTGENDFAFLRITSNIDGSTLPIGFKYIPMNINEIITEKEPVLLVSYPAGFLGGLSILQDLNITSAITKVNEVFTFKENTIDLISVPGTVVSQKGSSGGAVIDKYATLLGLISTSSGEDSTNARDLRAITLSYINRDLQAELGMNLKQFSSINSADFAKKFQEINAPALTKIIIDELNK